MQFLKYLFLTLSLSSFLAVPAFAIDEAAKDSVAATVKKAEALMLKRERSQAIQVLSAAIERAKARPKDQMMLIEKLKTVGQMFFSDEGQKAFEAAYNLYFFSPKEARTKADQALQLEPGNVQVLKLLAYLDLRDNQCAGAKTRLESLPKNIRDETERVYQKGLIYYCDHVELLDVDLKKIEQPYREFFTGIRFIQNKNAAAARGILLQALEKDHGFPEVYYWLWKLEEENPDFGAKYIQLCKNADTKLYRKYKNFPFLCGHVNEMPALEVNDDV